MSEDWFSFPELPVEPGIAFEFHEVDCPSFFDEETLVAWITTVIDAHQAELGEVQYIFCSDDYLHQLNVEHLNHDTLTDIITFPYAEPPVVSGDMFISLERVADNAKDNSTTEEDEFHRVVIHGILHLIGFGDKSPEEASNMRTMENQALAMKK